MPQTQKNADWLSRDLAVNWHPYTQMKDCLTTPPIFIKKASGIRLYDEQDNFYYDTISSWWCNIHGHGHPVLNQALQDQLATLDHILFAGFTHESAILLAEQLVKVTPPGLNKVFFSDDGSTSVEVALKLSFQYWQQIGQPQKQKFIGLDLGYHGDTIGTMSVGGLNQFNQMFSPLFFEGFKIPSPYCYRCPYNLESASCAQACLKPLEELLAAKADKIAALIIEPLILGVGGMIVYPKAYLTKLAALTKHYNVHLILDEVATGFGRTGTMFAADAVSLTPDFMCLSKGLTGGYLPMGATLTTDQVYQAFYGDYAQQKTFYHGHTFTANPLCCAVASASLQLFESQNIIAKIQPLITFFHQQLAEFKQFKHVGDVRMLGFLAAFELVQDQCTKEPFPTAQRIGQKVYQSGLKHSLILRPMGSIIYLCLPLCATQPELLDILARLKQVFLELDFI